MAIPNANGLVSAATTSASNSFIANWQQLAADKLKANAAKKAADSAVANAAANPTTANTQLATDAQVQAIAQYNENIQTDRNTIDEYTAAIEEYQLQINAAQATIDSDELNLANDNLDPEAVPGIEANIAEANASIVENQDNIVNATTAITQAQTDLAQQEQGLATVEAQATGTASPNTVNNATNPQVAMVNGVPVPISQINRSAGAVPNNIARPASYNSNGQLNPGYLLDLNNNPVYVGTSASTAPVNSAAQAAAIQQQSTLALAQQQQTINSQQRAVNTNDWRVKLSLARGANYLYNSEGNTILAPLAITGGVIFPYMPSIETSYRATYSNYDLTHSNYRGYFYQNSYVDQVGMRAQFTAQNTSEANYLLAVIHFFRSVTKMFYGANDPNRGSPPPLVFLTGLGSYQFARHPCVVTSFNYTLPADVDYIRALSNSNLGTNQQGQQTRQSVVPNVGATSSDRLANNGLLPGAMPTTSTPPTTADLLNSPTYVPTKMEISLTLLPIQSRQQVSQNFNLRDFASGTLLNGGFW
jgi:hypothetical protein